MHGYPWDDEFPMWSFEAARCVFVYTKYDLCPLEGEHTRNSYVWEYINLLIYIFILIYVYKHVCMCICVYIFTQKNIEGLYSKDFSFH